MESFDIDVFLLRVDHLAEISLTKENGDSERYFLAESNNPGPAIIPGLQCPMVGPRRHSV